MAARRLIMVMLALLVLSSIAAALVPVEDAQRDAEQSSTTTTGQQAPSGELVPEQINAGADKRPTIEVDVGDQLVLTVTSRKPDQVAIPALGELTDVDSDAAARFDLLLSEPDSYAVRLVEAKRTIGRIEVALRGAGTPAGKGAKP